MHTPAFSPVATKAAVRALSPDDLVEAGSQVVLANTYHLYLQPGLEVIEQFGGFAPFMCWDGPTITDSGGYQVSFLWQPKPEGLRRSNPSGLIEESPLLSGSDSLQPFGLGDSNPKGLNTVSSVKITDEGAEFRSHIDGSKHLLTPEKSMEIQHSLGADIIMSLDQPLFNEMSKKDRDESMRRTYLWERRSYERWKQLEENRMQGTYQALFGIIQGGTDSTLRRECLQFILDLDFPGIAIGDECIGSDPQLTAEALDTVVDLLPTDKPLHALGLGGGPEGIFSAVERGVDLFDNTSITRMARTGLVFIYPEDGGSKDNKFRINLNNARFTNDELPISNYCSCTTCQTFSRAYLRHLLKSNEILGHRLTSVHNVYFINNLMKLIRESIKEESFSELKHEWL